MNQMKQAHFFQLPTQGSKYSIAHLQLANKSNKLLIATLRRQVYTFEYLKNALGILVPTAKEISFAYIPSSSEIKSIDAFNKSQGGKNDFVIGITILKSSFEDNHTHLDAYLNIYSDEEFNIDNIAQNCLCIELFFFPYHLTHADLISWVDNQPRHEKVFLLSGSDEHIHMFRESKDTHNYQMVDCELYFPEFHTPPAIVTWISVYYIDDNTRVTAFGCENGYLRLIKVNVKDNSIMLNQSTQFTSSIEQVQLVPNKMHVVRPKHLIELNESYTNGDELSSEIDMIVVLAILPGVHFTNVANAGLTDFKCFPRKDMNGVNICATIGDVDFDGQRETFIANSLAEVTLFKSLPVENAENEYALQLLESMKLVGPVFHLFYLDITGDGVKELIVFTMQGVYIYQHDRHCVEDALRRKIEKLSIGDFASIK